MTDSAGITITSSATPLWETGAEWKLSDEPVLQIGAISGDTNYQFHQAHTAYRLSDKRIAVANMGTGQIRYFDSTGTYITAVGRIGSGPGEWSQLYQLRRGNGDSLMVIQPSMNSRQTIISPEGEILDQFELDAVRHRSNIWAVGMTASGFVVGYSLAPPGEAQNDDHRMQTTATREEDRARDRAALDTIPPERRFTREVYQHFVYDRKGKMIDSIGLLPGQGESMDEMMQATFQPRGYYSVAGDRLYFAPGDKHEIRQYRIQVQPGIGASSALRTTAGEEPRAAMILERVSRREPDRSLLITPAVAETYKESQRKVWQDRIANGAFGGLGVNIETQIDHLAFPASFPAQSRLLVDAQMNIWEQRYNIPGDTLDTFSIYDPNGVWLGNITMPPSFRPTDIGADYILGIWRDEVDVDYVRMYLLRK